jgi:cell division inhibitor SepF
MPGILRKAGLYLGLVEDDEEGYDADGYPRSDRHSRDEHDYDDEPPARTPRTVDRPEARATVLPRRSFDDTATRGSAALDTSVRPAPVAQHDEGYRITTLHPRTYNEARAIGEHFREGTPVIMNLTEMDDTDAKRLVDFSAGLIFGLHGSIERVTNKVFLLSPEHVVVTAEDKARIVEGGFFNQS